MFNSSLVPRFSSGVGAERRAWYTLHAHVQKSLEFGRFVVSPLRMTRSDESADCAQRMVSLSQSIVEDVTYALSQLGRQHLKLKEEQQQAIEAICHGDDVFVSLPTGFGKSMSSCSSFLVCQEAWLHGWISSITVVSPLCSSHCKCSHRPHKLNL